MQRADLLALAERVDTSAEAVERLAAGIDHLQDSAHLRRHTAALLRALAAERDAAVRVCEAVEKALAVSPASMRAKVAWLDVDSALTAWRAAPIETRAALARMLLAEAGLAVVPREPTREPPKRDWAAGVRAETREKMATLRRALIKKAAAEGRGDG